MKINDKSSSFQRTGKQTTSSLRRLSKLPFLKSVCFLLVLTLLLLPAVSAYCNESVTRTYTDSSNFTEQINRTCSPEYNGSIGLGAILFLIVIGGGLLLAGTGAYKFTKSFISNKIIKKCLVIISLYLFSLTNTIVASLTEKASLGIADDLYIVMRFLNWGIYIAMVAMVIHFAFYTINYLEKRAYFLKLGEPIPDDDYEG